MLNKLGNNFSSEDIECIMLNIDADGDMNLSFEEFLQATYEGAIKKTLSKS